MKKCTPSVRALRSPEIHKSPMAHLFFTIRHLYIFLVFSSNISILNFVTIFQKNQRRGWWVSPCGRWICACMQLQAPGSLASVKCVAIDVSSFFQAWRSYIIHSCCCSMLAAAARDSYVRIIELSRALVSCCWCAQARYSDNMRTTRRGTTRRRRTWRRGKEAPSLSLVLSLSLSLLSPVLLINWRGGRSREMGKRKGKEEREEKGKRQIGGKRFARGWLEARRRKKESGLRA